MSLNRRPAEDTRREPGAIQTEKHIFTVFDSRSGGSYSEPPCGGAILQIIFRAVIATVQMGIPNPEGPGNPLSRPLAAKRVMSGQAYRLHVCPGSLRLQGNQLQVFPPLMDIEMTQTFQSDKRGCAKKIYNR